VLPVYMAILRLVMSSRCTFEICQRALKTSDAGGERV
jgi:hypothetical protein